MIYAAVFPEVALGVGFFILFVCMCVFCYKRVGYRDSVYYSWNKNKIKSREYMEIEINVGNVITRFENHNVNKDSVKKLELASFLYDTIQISFLVFSCPTTLWANNNDWAEFIIYFIRLFCLDLPNDLMVPLFAIYVIMLGTYLVGVVFYWCTKTSTNPTVLRLNSLVLPMSSMERNAPEAMNFFFVSLFFTFCRFCFKLVSCSESSPQNTGFFLIDSFYGDFSCWADTGQVPFLLFCTGLLIVMFLVALLWIRRRGVTLSAFPCSERFTCVLTLAKFLLCGVMVFFVQLPLVSMSVILLTWLVLAVVVVRKMPYLSYGYHCLHYNAYLFGAFVLGVYLSVCSILLALVDQYQLGLLYFLGAIFVLVAAIVGMTVYFQKSRADVFSMKSKAFAKELVQCILHGDMVRVSVDHLVANFCNDLTLSKYVLDILDKELSDEERATLTSFSPSKMPFLEWWCKWEFSHPKPGTVHRIVLHKIYRNTAVPKLLDLCCYEIVKEDEVGWRFSDRISEDMKSYMEELVEPVGDFDPKELLRQNRLPRRTGPTSVMIAADNIMDMHVAIEL